MPRVGHALGMQPHDGPSRGNSPVQVPSFPGNNDPELLIDAANLMSPVSPPRRIRRARRIRIAHLPFRTGAVHVWWQTMDPNGPAYGTVLKPDQNQPDPQQLHNLHRRPRRHPESRRCRLRRCARAMGLTSCLDASLPWVSSRRPGWWTARIARSRRRSKQQS